MQYVLLTTLYRVEIFYIGSRQQWVVNSLRSLLCLAALATLPIYKTILTAALLQEANLPDPGALLNYTLQRATVRYASLDAEHPII
jgi:hypothetical protein